MRSLTWWCCDAEAVAGADAAARLQRLFEVAVEFVDVFRMAEFLEDAGYEILVQVVTVSGVDSRVIQHKDFARQIQFGRELLDQRHSGALDGAGLLLRRRNAPDDANQAVLRFHRLAGVGRTAALLTRIGR